MNIHKNTRISDLIKENKASIEAIAVLARPLEKLRNPVLRKLMASRVTLEEAVKMSGCTLRDFTEALAPLGFVYEESGLKSTEAVTATKPSWLIALPPGAITLFDVRDMLASGHDPLKEIMQRFKSLQKGRALCIINTFEPVPLVRLLEKDEVTCFTEQKSDREFYTYFFKQADKALPAKKALPRGEGEVFNDNREAFDALLSRYPEKDTVVLDVRALDMPGPMQAILEALAVLPPSGALYVHHKRVPVYLLEELAGKGFEIHICNTGEGAVKLLIFKQ